MLNQKNILETVIAEGEKYADGTYTSIEEFKDERELPTPIEDVVQKHMGDVAYDQVEDAVLVMGVVATSDAAGDTVTPEQLAQIQLLEDVLHNTPIPSDKKTTPLDPTVQGYVIDAYGLTSDIPTTLGEAETVIINGRNSLVEDESVEDSGERLAAISKLRALETRINALESSFGDDIDPENPLQLQTVALAGLIGGLTEAELAVMQEAIGNDDLQPRLLDILDDYQEAGEDDLVTVNDAIARIQQYQQLAAGDVVDGVTETPAAEVNLAQALANKKAQPAAGADDPVNGRAKVQALVNELKGLQTETQEKLEAIESDDTTDESVGLIERIEMIRAQIAYGEGDHAAVSVSDTRTMPKKAQAIFRK
ncbi:MAG: hypothetical protein R3A45_05770 [Bdellovibrionota bacterium]